MGQTPKSGDRRFVRVLLGGLIALSFASIGLFTSVGGIRKSEPVAKTRPSLPQTEELDNYVPRMPVETSGLLDILARIKSWGLEATVDEIAEIWSKAAPLAIEDIDRGLSVAGTADVKKLELFFSKYAVFNAQGQTGRAYDLLREMRSWVEKDQRLKQVSLYSIIFNQGVVAMRRRDRKLHHVPRRKLVHPPDHARRCAHESRRLTSGDPAFHRIPPPIS